MLKVTLSDYTVIYAKTMGEAVILRKAFEHNYFVIKLLNGVEILVSADFLKPDLN